MPRLSQGLRTAVCHCSNVPAVWLGHRAIRLALEPELEPAVQTGLFPPGGAECSRPDDLAAQPLISDQEPSAEAARAHTAPHAPDLSKESPMGNQAVSGLLG